MSATANLRPVIFGEVLFDCFEDGDSVLGGAPFNVAWHLQGLGLEPCLISRVGDDARGEHVLQTMRDWGMDSGGMQIDPHHPTGEVRVSLRHGQPSFEIVPQQAYDYIAAEAATECLAQRPAHMLYHGSLARRNPVSAAALDALLERGLPRFVDVNLRAPWWQEAAMPELLRQSRWLKLNHEELERLAPSLGLEGDFPGQLALDLQRRYQVATLLVTHGEHGAFLLDEAGQVYNVRPSAQVEVVDTVGAGDAFSAMLIAGLLQGWPLQDLMWQAQKFAEAVCGQRGATRPDPGLYARFRTPLERP